MRTIILSVLFLTVNSFSLLSQNSIFDEHLLFSEKKTISLELEKAKLVDVLKLLSQQIDLNFISSEGIKDRELSLYMADVPLREAMDIIFKANNLTYDFYPEADIFVVKETVKPGRKLKTKVYRLRYARLKTSKLEKEMQAAMSLGTGSGGGGDPEQLNGIEAAVQSVLSEAGKIIVDSAANSLIVIDVPEQFPIIDEVVSKVDVLVPKVMIEVEMLDVNKRAIEKLGIDWPEIIGSLDMTLAQRASAFPFGDTTKKNVSGDTASIVVETATPSGWKGVSWQTNNFGPTILTAVGAELVLNFFQTQSDTKYLARPKILTLSNQTAEIRITTDEAIGISKSTDESGEVTWEIERAETGTKLRVTPQVDESTGMMSLFVEMGIKEAKDSGFSTDSNLITGTIKNPEERATSSIVRLGNGETLLLGGLIRNSSINTERKIPILGDIPIIGRAFRHKHDSIDERELIVFITPHIVKDGDSLVKNSEKINRDRKKSLYNSYVKYTLDKLSK